VTELLNTVDAAGNITGTATREQIHREGLLHREVDVWFYTPAGEIIFQRRSKTKNTFPGMLSPTVGGHVEIGQDWLTTAIKEISKESGLELTGNVLNLVTQFEIDCSDSATGMRNHALQRVYSYCYTGNVVNLHAEAGKADGFEAWSVEKLIRLEPQQLEQFTFHLIPEHYPALFETIIRQGKTI